MKVSRLDTIGHCLVAGSALFFSGCAGSSEDAPETTPQETAGINHIAYAYPVSGIDIDGRIDDWPENLAFYPIEAALENVVDRDEDLKAGFFTGYASETRSVYLAVVVRDDVHVLDDEAGGLTDQQDHLLFYLDKQHAPAGSGVNVFGVNALYREIDDAQTSWDPAVRNPDWDNLRVASTRSGDMTVYEIELTLDDAPAAGRTIGVDFMLYDPDGETSDEDTGVTRVAWRNTDGKTNVPFKLGHVVMLEEGAELGAMSGKLVWKEEPLGDPINRIRITSPKDKSFSIRHPVDVDGQYAAQLPPGVYDITPEWGIYNGGDIQHRVIKNTIQAEILPQQETSVPDLEIEIAAPLDLIPAEGVLMGDAPDKNEQIDQFVQAYMDYYEIPGVSLAIIENGKMSYHQTYGVENTYTKDPVDETTIFEAASITKPVFGFAVLRLAERGVIDLDRPLYEYMPLKDIADDERHKLITARHVLSHQTGLPNWRSGALKLEFTPGTAFGYSGEGIEYLGRVIAHITGKDLVQILDEEVLQPLELQNIYFEKSDKLFKIVAHGHDDIYPHKVSLPNRAGMAWSMHTEAKSFAPFAEALIARRGLKPETYEDMFAHHTVTDKYEDTENWESYFGLSLQIEETPLGTAIGHGGNNGDFKCEFKVFPELGVGFIAFTNGNTGDQLTSEALERFLITGQTR
ncbi:MAG: serine hydrolase [Pseudomonadota bacterium]